MKIENADNGKSIFDYDFEVCFNVSKRINRNDPIRPNPCDIRNEVIKRFNMHEELAELIARNLVAWDTSKDKTQGLLPEVYLSNRVMYKRLTGEDYCYIEAIKRFNID